MSTPYEFVSSYYNSPGFLERLRKAKKLLSSSRTNLNVKKELKFTFPKQIHVNYNRNPKIPVDNSSYDSDTKTLNLGLKPMSESTMKNIAFDTASIESHELGHAVDDAISVNGVDFKTYPYSQIYPIFRESKSYKLAISEISNSTNPIIETLRQVRQDNKNDSKIQRETEWIEHLTEKDFENNPHNYVNIAHDASPTESYADLMAFREALYRFNIYDSRKDNNLFTIEHLNKWKSLNKHLRLFNNFTDDQIIQMMNEVAQNNTSQDNLYAKKGVKLAPRKFKRFK